MGTTELNKVCRNGALRVGTNEFSYSLNFRLAWGSVWERNCLISYGNSSILARNIFVLWGRNCLISYGNSRILARNIFGLAEFPLSVGLSMGQEVLGFPKELISGRYQLDIRLISGRYQADISLISGRCQPDIRLISA